MIDDMCQLIFKIKFKFIIKLEAKKSQYMWQIT